MKNLYFPTKRFIAAVLTLVCLLGLLPTVALAASPGTITLTKCDQTKESYISPALGSCRLHTLTFNYNGANRVGFCADHGKGMGWSLEGQPWGSPQPINDPTIKSLMAYYYAFTTGTFTDKALAAGATQWDSGMAGYMNAWVQAVIWRYKTGQFSDPVTACAEEMMYAYNNIGGFHYNNIDDAVDGSSFRSRVQYNLDMGTQGFWGNCEVYEYRYAGSSTDYQQANNVQAIIIGELTITPTTHESYTLVVKKVDVSDPSKSLAGAAFQVSSDEGFSQRVVTGDNGTHILENLEAGTYTIIETGAPEGYEIDPTPQYVTLPGGGSTVTVTFMDTPEEPGEGTIRKVDADDPTKGLAGAVIKIEGVDNDFTGTYTTGDGGYLTDVPWDKLPKGSYTATEVTPPEGYTKSSDPGKVRQTFEWDGKTDIALVFENDAKVKVRLIKLDDSDNPLPGAVFAIFKDGQIIGTEATKADGSITVTDVTEGLYAFLEVSAPAPYATLTEPVLAHVDQATINGGGTVTVTASDKKLPSLTILKKDEQTGNVIPGTTFEVKAIDGSYHNDVVTGADGKATLSNIPAGSYEVTEKSVPDPYVVGEVTTQTIYLAPGENRELVFDNMKRPELTISKVEQGTNTPIPGTLFTLEAIDSDYRHDVTTGADGTVSLRVAPGSYRVIEKSVPAPYCLPENESDCVQTVSLNAGDSKELIFKNSKQPLLKISKIEKGAGDKIPGTVFTIEAINGDYRHEVTTGTDGSVELRVAPGSYKVTEKSVPEPYVIGENPSQTVSLHGGDEKELIFENLKKPLLTIAKIDADSGDIIPGTVFTIQGVSNDYRHTVTTGADGTVSLRVAAGTYKITEKSVPAPYYLPSLNAEREQTISLNPGDEKTVTFRDHKAPELTIYKEDSVAGAPIEGAKFHVTCTSNGEAAEAPSTINFGYIFTDSRGEIKVHEHGKKMYPGEYTVTEVEPAPGFQMKEPTTQKVIIHGGESKTLTFQNEPLNGIIVEKYDSVTHAALPGCTFQLRYLGGTSGTGGTVIGQKVTGKNGTAIWTGLKSGTYILEEVDPADGYSIINASETVYLADSGEQSVVTVRFENSPDGVLLIRKVCSVNPSVTLQDTEFKIAYADGTLIGDSNGIYRTDEAGEIRIPGLKPGKSVIVTETKAPNGFIIDTQSQTIQIKEGRTVTLTFKNQPKGKIIIQKRDSQTGQPLPGAEFRVTTAAGCEVGLDGVIGTATLTQNGLFTTDANGEIRISNLAPGAYVLTETKAPAGYVMDSPSTNVVIGPNGDTQIVVITNTPKATLTILKRDAVTRKPLANAEFIVRDSEGHAVGPTNGIYKTGTDGTVVVSGLEPGSTIVVSESRAPSGYILDETPKSIVVKSGISNSLTFDNEPGTTLIIQKFIDGTENEPLSGVCFKVVDGSGAAVGPDDGCYYTDKAGEIVLTGIEPGTTVKAREIKTVDGFVLDGTPQDILIKGGEVQRLTFWNKRAGTLLIEKLDSVTKAPLAGAQFKVLYADGRVVDTEGGKLSSNGIYHTDKNGQIKITGITGTLVVTEEKAPDGYVIDPNAKNQTVVVNPNDTQTLRFYNEPLCSLTLRKLDSVTGRPVPGTEFTVKDGNGTVLGRYTTGKDGTVTVTGLIPGSTVVVVESKVPSDYVLDPTPRTIIVRNGSNSVNTGAGGGGTNGGGSTGTGGGNDLTIENDPKTRLVIEKYITGTTTPLKGVTFLVTESNGQVLGANNGKYVTDENGRIVIEGLEPGVTINVKELRTVEGFILDTTPKSIKIKAGAAQTLRFYNQKQGALVIRKLDSVTKEPLAGVEFQLTYSDGSYVDADNGHLSSKGLYTTNRNGEIRISGITGTVVVTETRTIDGYSINEAERTQTVKINPADTQRLTFYNTPVGGLELIKVSEADRTQRIPNVTFEIRKINGGLVDTVTTDKRGRVYLDLDAGNYYAVEIETAPGFQPDSTPIHFSVQDGKTTTLTVTNKPLSGIIIHKVDSVTGKGIYAVKFLVYDANKNPIGEFSTDNEGYIYIENLTVQGKLFIRELEAAPGYELDKEYKTVYVKPGETTEITWKNTPITGQIQIQKYAAEYNEITGTPAGAPLQGAVYEISEARSGKVVDYLTTDARGVAASRPLPLGRYKITETTAPAHWQLSGTVFDETLEYSGQIIKLSDYDKPAKLGVSITKWGNAEVLAGNQMRYDFTVANTSNVPLSDFYWHECALFLDNLCRNTQ